MSVDPPPTPTIDSDDEFLLLGLRRGRANDLLQRSAELLDESGQDGRARLRWYVATDAAVVLGRGQRHANPIPGHAQLQRPSGGGAVLMDDELLSLDVVLPAGHRWLLDTDLGTVFDPIGRAWAAAMVELGVPDVAVHAGPATATRLGPEEQRPLAEICYASLGRAEVTSGGRKLVGLSQRRRRQGALIQCGIHRVWTPDVLIEALGVQVARDAIHDAAIGVDQVTTHAISDRSIVDVVQRHLQAA